MKQYVINLGKDEAGEYLHNVVKYLIALVGDIDINKVSDKDIDRSFQDGFKNIGDIVQKATEQEIKSVKLLFMIFLKPKSIKTLFENGLGDMLKGGIK